MWILSRHYAQKNFSVIEGKRHDQRGLGKNHIWSQPRFSMHTVTLVLWHLGKLESLPYNLDALIWNDRADLINRMILNLIPGSLVILLEIQIKFRIPSEINIFSSTSFVLKYESQLDLRGSKLKRIQCQRSLVKALMHLCYRLKGNSLS